MKNTSLRRPLWHRLTTAWGRGFIVTSIGLVICGAGTAVLLPGLAVLSSAMIMVGCIGLGTSGVLIFRMDAMPSPSHLVARTEQMEWEIEALDREIMKWIPEHQCYADVCGIEVDRSKPPPRSGYVVSW